MERSPLGPLAVLHLFKASIVCHKRETVEKIKQESEIISEIFGLQCLINSVGFFLFVFCSLFFNICFGVHFLAREM